jgi:hypothetical protein
MLPYLTFATVGMNPPCKRNPTLCCGVGSGASTPSLPLSAVVVTMVGAMP